MRDTIAHLWITLSVSRATTDSSPPRGKICYRASRNPLVRRYLFQVSLSASRYRAQRAKRKKESERLMVINEFVREIPRFLLTPAFLFFATLEIPTNDSRIKPPRFPFFSSSPRRSKAKTREENRGRESVRSNETIRIPAAEDGRPFPSARIYTHTYIYIDGDEPFTRTTKPRLRSHRT